MFQLLSSTRKSEQRRQTFLAAILIIWQVLVPLGPVFNLQAVHASNGESDPPGNNGTVKLDGTEFDSHPNNEPHVGCTFQIDFYGFDEGVGDATVTFELQAPTTDGEIVVSGDTSPDIGEDAAGGGDDLDASVDYTLSFTGDPHPQQGYHIKLTVNAPGSQGNDTKYKTFWVEDCQPEPETGSIKIVKDAQPNSDQDFAFNFSGSNSSQVLDDDNDPTRADNVTFSNLDPDSYTITETEVEGWSLEGVNCTGAEHSVITDIQLGVSIELAAGEDIVCTFVNVEQQPELNLCDPSQKPGGMSIAEWLEDNDFEAADCFKLEVSQECGFLDVSLARNDTPYNYEVLYVIGDTIPDVADWDDGNAFPANFDEDQNDGLVEVTYYIVGEEADYFAGYGIPNVWDGIEGDLPVQVDTDCEEDPVTDINPIFECWMVDPNNAERFIAYFGYENNTGVDEVEVPYGPDNTVTPSEYESYFPTTFEYPAGDIAGREGRTNFFPDAAIMIDDWDGSNIVWNLTDQGTATGSINGPKCPEPGEIRVTKFNDINLNGVYDEFEETLSGWEITVEGQENQFTDENGQALFENLYAGTYTVGEVLDEEAPWTQSSVYCEYGYQDAVRLLPELVIDQPDPSSVARVESGETTDCFIGNYPDLVLELDKSNNQETPQRVGEFITYTLVVTVPEYSGTSFDTKVVDLPPEGFSYVAGSWTASSSVGSHDVAADVAAAGGPSYSSPGTWSLGTMLPGEVVTLTYQVQIQQTVADGTYPDSAYATGNSTPQYTNGDVSATLLELPNQVVYSNLHITEDDPFVETAVQVISDTEPAALFTAAITRLPNTGLQQWMAMITPILAGVAYYWLIERKRRFNTEGSL